MTSETQAEYGHRTGLAPSYYVTLADGHVAAVLDVMARLEAMVTGREPVDGQWVRAVAGAVPWAMGHEIADVSRSSRTGRIELLFEDGRRTWFTPHTLRRSLQTDWAPRTFRSGYTPQGTVIGATPATSSKTDGPRLVRTVAKARSRADRVARRTAKVELDQASRDLIELLTLLRRAGGSPELYALAQSAARAVAEAEWVVRDLAEPLCGHRGQPVIDGRSTWLPESLVPPHLAG